jgi:hypothetical protein
VATPLLGWPEHGFRAAWGGLALPDAVVIALCVLRTGGAVLFTLGVWTRAAGTVAAVAALVVLSQDAFGFKFTLYTLFVGTLLLAVSGGGCRFALRPSPPGIGPSPWLVRAFVASVYAWSAIAKLRGTWLSGETLRTLYQAHYLTGELADVLFATLARCHAAAWGVVIAELLLGPMLLLRRTRLVGLVLAVGMHAAYEWTAQPDVFGWVMAALLISFTGSSDLPTRRRGRYAPPIVKFLAPIAVLVVLAACSSSSSAPSGPTGTGGHSCSQYTLCTKSGNTFTCDCGGGSMPACPASANEGQSCSAASSTSCMTCTNPGTMSATLICQCKADADGGLAWSCIGGEQACSE